MSRFDDAVAGFCVTRRQHLRVLRYVLMCCHRIFVLCVDDIVLGFVACVDAIVVGFCAIC